MEKIKKLFRQENQAAVSAALIQLWYLLKKLKPSRIEGDVVFGTGDPATTGQILGAVAALYGFVPEKLHITPDFEEQRYEGRICAKGKIRLIHLLIVAVRLFSDKNFRSVAKQLLDKEDVEDEQ